MATPVVQGFLEDPDQTSRRAELIAFCGPNADGFLAVYDRMFAVANRDPSQGRGLLGSLAPWLGGGFCAPAFFLGFVWFFYRRMWVWGGGFVLTMILIEWVPGTSQIGLVLAIAMALIARRLYVGHSISAIARLRAQTGPNEDSSRFLLALRSAGGVSRGAGWLSGGVFLLITLITLASRLAQIP